MNRRLTLALAVFASFAPAIALGLGLGDIRLHSALNQPLDAEIDLLAATDDEINSIKVRLASPDQFDRYGIDRIAALASLKFDVVKRANGRAYVHITSDQALREPFLTFLVEASWPRGRLLREYTVLLDPPVLAPAPQAATEEPTTAPVGAEPYAAPVAAGAPGAQPPAQPQYVAPEPTTAPVIETPVAAAPGAAPSSAAPSAEPQPEPLPGADAPSFDASNYGPVRRGETLWGISARLKPEQAVTMNQMMIAVFRANPDAFRGNINRLKRGAILRIPDASEITAISVAEANAEAIRHNDEWQATRVAVTTTPSDTGTSAPEPQPEPVPAAPVAQPAPQPSAQPAPAQSAPSPAAPATAAPAEPSLAIVAPSDDLGAPSTDPAARVAELEKQLAEAKAAGTNTKRKRDRIARLEKELGEARAALTVTSDTLAQLQDQAAPTPATAPVAVPATAPAAAPATVPTEAPAQVAPSRPKKGTFDTLLDNLFNPIVLMLLALAVLVPIGAIGFKKLKARQATRKAAAAEIASWGEPSEEADKTVVGGDEPTLKASRSAMPETGSEEPTVMRGPDPALLAATGETVAIPDEQVQKTVMLPREELDKTIMQTMAVEQRPPMAMEPAAEPAAAAPQSETVVGGTPLKLDENDPMSEADFHMAYGLYDQAADLIKKASQRDPARRDLRLKLLEIYFSAGNKGAFVSEAKALRESMGPRPDADWNNVVIFGKQIAPEEGMFNEMAAASSAVDFDASAAGGATSAASDLAFDPFAAPEPAPAAAPAAAPAPAAAAPVVDVPLEFELGDFQLDAAPAKPAASPPPAPERKEHTESQSDFDKALAELSAFVDTNVPKEVKGAEAGDLDLGEIQLDDGALEVEEESAGSEIDTKLDLARAYIDMMDPGSAKGILEEVLADGDDKQKAEAQKLLKQLG
jgi:pilus assembly protein FimV